MTDSIPISSLARPRIVFRWPDLESVKYMELVASVKASGILTPLVVRHRRDGRLEIIDGLWRLSVAKELGIESVPCTVIDLQLDEALLLAARLNADHCSPGDLTGHLRSYLRTHTELTMAGMSQRLHKSPAWISDALSLRFLDGATNAMVLRGEMPLQSAYFLSKLRNREHFVDLARSMTAVAFKPVILVAIRKSRNARRDHLNRRNYPETFSPRTWLRTVNTVRAEHETEENGLRQITESMEPLDGWRAAIRWVLNIDPAGIERQRRKFEHQRR